MKLFTTSIQAIDPVTNELTKFAGPQVPGETFRDAESYCENNGLGYCKVEGQLVSEIKTKTDGFTPDWGSRIDYDNLN